MCLIRWIILLGILLPVVSWGKQSPELKQDELLKKLRTAKSTSEKIKLYEDLYDVYMEFDHRRAFKYLEELSALSDNLWHCS